MGYKRINFKQAREILDSKKNAVLVDVRDEDEFITGHPTEAVLLPVDCITKESADDVIGAFDTPVIVYCRTGVRSAEAAEILAELGYTEVYDLGSLIGWPYSKMV